MLQNITTDHKYNNNISLYLSAFSFLCFIYGVAAFIRKRNNANSEEEIEQVNNNYIIDKEKSNYL